METCKNCIHYELCEYNTYQEAHYFGRDKKIYITIQNNSACKFFNQKSDLVKVVRCKDCINRVQFDTNKYHCELTGYYCGETGYCSDGVRKD